MTPQELNALISKLETRPWTDFTKNPSKASRQIHVSKADVRRGERLDTPSVVRRTEATPNDPRDELFFNALLRDPPAYELPAKSAEAQHRERKKAYGERAPKVTGNWRNSIDVLKHAFMRDDDAKDIAKGLALTAGLAGGVAAPLMVPAAPALTGAAINALTGIPINMAFGAPEGVPQDAVAGALMGKLAGAGHPGLGALAGLASYAATSVPEAEAGVWGKLAGKAQRAMSQASDLPTSTSAPLGALSVVKPKGGNWINNSVEDALRGLKKRGTVPGLNRGEEEASPEFVENIRQVVQNMRDIGNTRRADILEEAIPGAARNSQLNSWIDRALTPYVKNRMASPADEVRLMADKKVAALAAQRDAAMKQAEKARLRAEAIKAAGPKPGMPPGTWEGAVANAEATARRLAAEAQEAYDFGMEHVLHFQPRGLREQSPIMRDVVEARTAGGFAPQGYADSPIGDQWEKYADAAIDPRKVRDFTGDQRTIYEPGNEWMKKATPDTPVYRPDLNQLGDYAHENLGFNHLIDELSNAANPASGLPPHLQLSPEAIQNMSMEKAVGLVADINAWRAAQQVAANQELANKASVIREYTDPTLPNPKGLRWVELRAGDIAPEGDASYGNKAFGWQIANDARRADLEKQLKYEGETMGHCVGGYCPDVLEGRSRIFSLRDAKGQPHVTVEVEPPKENFDPQIDAAKRAFGDAWEDYVDPELLGQLESRETPSILQIKGKQNRAPNPEYLPFVQDFVRNSPLGGAWGDVGDLQNSGLRKITDAFGPNELKMLDAASIQYPTHGTAADFEDLHSKLNAAIAGRQPKFASGGSVRKKITTLEDLQGIIEALEAA